LLGLGLTLPGLVDIDTGILTFSPNHQWRDVPLGKIFGEHTGLPVFVDNDANAGALGEHLFGVARSAQHFVFIVAGVGIGSGLFLNGDLYRGAGGYAGEIGHTSVSGDHSRLCRCGNRGCWENSGNQYALIERVHSRLDVGRRSMVRELIEETRAPLSIAVINQAAESGDAEALEALHETGFAIGMGAANLINIFNPEMVVIGGSLSVAGKFLLPAILEAIQQRTLADTRQQAQVVLSAFGREASVMGAVAMVIKAILADPARVERASRQMA
jgi:predicted NBD/HSP70 family sugar kinase